MKNFKKRAQSLIEYGLILALVAVIAMTVLSKLGKSVTDAGDRAANSVNVSSENAMNNYCASLGKSYCSGTGQCADSCPE